MPGEFVEPDSRLRSIFGAVLGEDAGAVRRTDLPQTIKGWDSVTHIHLILALEAEYGIQLAPEELADLMSVGAITERLAAHGVE